MRTRLILSLIVMMSAGCGSKGSHQWFETANPSTSLTVKPNIVTGTLDVDFYSNDGRAMTADRIYCKKGELEFEATNLNITERSVENREANVAQVAAIGVSMAQIAKANWEGAANFMSNAVGVAAVLGHRAGASGEDISSLQGLIDAAKALNGQPAKPEPTTQPTE